MTKPHRHSSHAKTGAGLNPCETALRSGIGAGVEARPDLNIGTRLASVGHARQTAEKALVQGHVDHGLDADGPRHDGAERTALTCFL